MTEREHQSKDESPRRNPSRSPPGGLSLCLSPLLFLVACSTAPPSTPPIGVRNAHALFFDEVRGRVVLYGGADASRVLDETWEWNRPQRRWERIDTPGPGARTFPAVAYDRARGEAVLFGGNQVLFGRGDETDTFLADTWVWRGARWVRRGTATHPGPRAEAAMAYDPRRERVVLFGGYRRTAAGTLRLGDTWEWDGNGWREVATTGPAPRNGAALAYDQRLNAIVLSGGPPAFVTSETWFWDGRVWTKAEGPGPPGRFNPVMIYHGGLEALLRFGGWTGSERADDTWIRDARGWSHLEISGPSARNHTAMAYDPRAAVGVLFGGHDGDRVFGDTWEIDGRGWRRVGCVPSERRLE